MIGPRGADIDDVGLRPLPELHRLDQPRRERERRAVLGGGIAEAADVSRGTREAAGAHRLAVAQEDRAILRAAEIGKFQRGLRARDLVRPRLVGACAHRRGGAAGLGYAAVAIPPPHLVTTSAAHHPPPPILSR